MFPTFFPVKLANNVGEKGVLYREKDKQKEETKKERDGYRDGHADR